MDHRSLIAFLAGSLSADAFSAEIRGEVRVCNEALASGGVGSIIVTDAPETRVTREHASRLLQAVSAGTLDFELANYIADALIMSDDFEFEDEAVSGAIFFLADDSRAPTKAEIDAALAQLRSAGPAESTLIAAHKHCARHDEEIARSTSCGCFYCLAVFLPAEIEDWVDDEPRTALCPRCGIDSVIGDASGFPVTAADFLGAMNVYWFQRTVSLGKPKDASFTRKVVVAWRAFRGWLSALRTSAS
jgi:hypothetical protein